MFALLPVLLVLIPRTGAQLLFPVNQVPFELRRNATASESGGPVWHEPRPPRIAIVGAGASGSSAAFFLSHFGALRDAGLATDVTIYDSNEYVGGRSTVLWPWNDDPLHNPSDPRLSTDAVAAEEDDVDPVEMGASIFVAANKNLQKARRDFGLKYEPYGGEEGNTAIWDGEQWVFEETNGFGWDWWHKAKALWRYGRSPFTVRSLVKETVGNFLNLYSPAFVSQGAFASLGNFSTATHLRDAASKYANHYLSSKGVGDLFTNELISAATQVNYGTPIDRLHGVGALVSLAATGAVSVKGGNRQIFEEFVGRSGASLRLGEDARVHSLMKLDAAPGKRAQWLLRTASGVSGGTYDAVIFAAPFHQTGIQFSNSMVSALIPKQPYVRLYVTFVITNATTPQPSYFGLPDSTRMPNEIFGTFTTPSSSKPTFNSLNYLKALPASVGARFGEGTYHVVKMFSDHSLQRDMLEALYGKHNVAKTVEKIWLSYPQLQPVTSDSDYAPVRPDEGFYYPNGFERLISTMETSTVSSFNAVSLLLHDFFGYTPPASWAEWPDDLA